MVKYDYIINNNHLDRVNSFNDLGITINSTFTWIDHLKVIRSKAMRNLGYIKRILGYQAPFEAKKLLYLTHVRSLIQYGSQLWSPFKKSEMSYLEAIQRHATKFICGYTDETYSDRLIRTNLLPLAYIREIHDLLLFCNIINGRLNVSIDQYFIINPYLRRGRSNADGINIVPKLFRSNARKNFYTSRILPMWNKVPDHIKCIAPPANRRSKWLSLKKALYKRYFQLTMLNFDVNNICTWTTVCACHNCRS
jgi:hypothetical protein